MSSNITILGLGELGASFAMALKELNPNIQIIGSDCAKSAEKRASDNKWVDRIEHNLFDAVRDADAVILAVAHDEFSKLSIEEVDSFFGTGKKILLDIKGILDKNTYEAAGYSYWRL